VAAEEAAVFVVESIAAASVWVVVTVLTVVVVSIDVTVY
jgi:hypothetical protein